MKSNAAVAAIEFALEDEDGDGFLRNWNAGEFDVLRKHWPEAPDAVYIGADPLHPGTAAILAADAELAEMKRMLREAAKPDCTGCDGTGIYLGNVCICGCVSAANIPRHGDSNET